MQIALLIVGLGILGLLGYVAWETKRKPASSNEHAEEIGTLKTELEHEKTEKNKWAGENKRLFVENTNLIAERESLLNEKDALSKRVHEYEITEKSRAKEKDLALQQLDAAKISFENEQKRVIRQDEEKRIKELEERDRMWAAHENEVIHIMTDLCKQAHFSFTSYTNVNLPEGFDGSLKPDFMIDFLGQYVIFDAKVSKAKSLQTYINTVVKDTVDKVKNNDRIYKSIFLVVPATALSELKSHHYTVDGYQLFVVSPEALPPILACLKRITMYEFAEALDPQQRENIVQMIADLDFHINLRNAADIYLSSLGVEILEKAKKIDPALSEEVEIKKAPMNAKASIAAGGIKKMVMSIAHQKEQINHMIAPKSPINTAIVQEAGDILSDTLSK